MANERNTEAFGLRIGVLSGRKATSLESLISYVFSLSFSQKNKINICGVVFVCGWIATLILVEKKIIFNDVSCIVNIKKTVKILK